jgi:SAM-dependent methyltransferase
MVAVAVREGRGQLAHLVLADVTRLPLVDQSLDAIFAAGLLPHLGDPIAGLRELARVSHENARLALFHPIGRAALAGRHGHLPHPDDIRAEPRIRAALAQAGWSCELVDDADSRSLVLAVRDAGTS